MAQLKDTVVSGDLRVTDTLNANCVTAQKINELLVGVGTAGQAGSTSVAYIPSLWTFNTGRAAVVGDLVTIKIPVAGVNSGVWMSIDNGVTYYPVAISGTTRHTTHFGVGVAIQLILESGLTTAIYGTDITGAAAGASTSNYTGLRWSVINFYDTNSTYTVSNNLLGNGTFIAANASVYRYQCLMKTDADHMSPFATSASTGTNKTVLTSAEYDPFGGFYYYTTNATVTSGSAIAVSSMHYTCTGIDLRYSFNITTSAFTAQKDVYLKLSPRSNGKVILAGAVPVTQTLPTSNDGYWYMFLGRAYNGYCINLLPFHPILYHDGAGIREKFRTQDSIRADMGTISSLPVTKTVPGVTENMTVISSEIGNPSAFVSNLTITTAANSITIAGVMKTDGSTSTLKLTLASVTEVTAS